MVKFDFLPHEICRITSPFGYRTNPITGAKGSYHQGIDIGAKAQGIIGDKLFAVADGEVVHKQSMMDKTYGYGHFSIIEHDGFCTLYAHMLQEGLKVGTKVKAGMVVGLMGSSGASTGAHLHFEVQPIKWTGYTNYIKRNGQDIRINNIDPYQFIENYRLQVIKEGKKRKMELDIIKKQLAELKTVRYKNISEMPVHYQSIINDLVDREIIRGHGDGNLDMTEDMIRTLIMADRMDKKK